jgi:hypothetical protein
MRSHSPRKRLWSRSMLSFSKKAFFFLAECKTERLWSFWLQAARVVQARMAQGRNGSEIGIIFLELRTSLPHPSNRKPWSTTCTNSRIHSDDGDKTNHRQMLEKQKGFAVWLGRQFTGLSLNDWMTNSILGAVIEDVTSMQFSFDALRCFILPIYHSLRRHPSLLLIPIEMEMRESM